MTRACGFAMIEVLVALVLVTSVGVAIVLWAESGLHAMTRLRDEYARVQVARTAQDLIRTLPDTADETGTVDGGGWRIDWQRRADAQGVQTGYPAGFGAHDVVLMHYSYKVYRGGDAVERAWFEDAAMVAVPRMARTFKLPQ
ncbi:MAG: type II secretion system protein [Rhodocyclaceae bacterium]